MAWIECRLGGCFPTIDAGIWKHHTLLIEIEEVKEMEEIECLGGINESDWGGQYRNQDRVYAMNQVSCAIATHIKTLYLEVNEMRETEFLGNYNGFGDGRHSAYSGSVYSSDGSCPTIDCCGGGGREPKTIETQEIGTSCGSQEVEYLGDWIWKIGNKKYKIRIRKLTPRECFRLMDFAERNEDGSWNDEIFERAEKVCSNTQLYKQSGNSIVRRVIVKALEPIFKNGGIK